VCAICAVVPYLRPGDLLPAAEGETPVRTLYCQIGEAADGRRSRLPFIVTGHLHGGAVSELSERRIILGGEEAISEGARRRRLERAAQAMFAQEFAGRVLPFDAEAADVYADLRVLRARSGRPLAAEDGMIAAIAKVQGAAAVATCDVGGLDGCGLALVNPRAA
jgi:predicted nucleic acid-binding protein